MAITSKEINLVQLDQELTGQGLCADFNDPKKKLIVPANNSTVTEDDLKTAIAAHVAIDDYAVRQAQRQVILDRLGLTADEAQLLLG